MSDICGYTSLCERHDPEEIDELLQLLKREAERIVSQYGGMVNQFVGDEVVALFGADRSQEDELRRGVCATLDLHAALRNTLKQMRLLQGETVQLHSGIASGLVVLRRADPRGGVFSLAGDAVNLASRLCSQAKANEVLVDSGLEPALRPFFDMQQLSALNLKGKSQPVGAHLILTQSDTKSRFEAAQKRGLTQLAGRRRELDRLVQQLKQTLEFEGSVVTIVGEAGIGKSRMLHELCVQANEHRVRLAQGHCSSLGAPVPYRPFVTALRQLLKLPDSLSEGGLTAAIRAQAPQLKTDDPAWGVPEFFGRRVEALSGLSPEQVQHRVVQDVVDLLNAVAGRHSTAVILEDWQWADDGSRRLLDRLIPDAQKSGYLLVVTSRSPIDSDRLAPNAQLSLVPLDPTDTSTLIDGVVGAAQGGAWSRLIHEHTGGNPLFVEEVCDALLRKGAFSGPVPERLAAPETVDAVLRERVDSLEPTALVVLGRASLLGDKFDKQMLATLLRDRPDLDAVLNQLEEQEFVRKDGSSGGYAFRHAIVREVVYRSLLLRERRQLHWEVAKLFEGRAQDGTEDYHESLAYHYGRAKAVAQAAQYSELAAVKAERAFSLEQARRHYQDALLQLDQLEPSKERDERRIAASLRWAQVCLYSPAPSQIGPLEESYRLAVEHKKPRAGALAQLWMGWLAYALGDQVQAQSRFHRAKAIAENIDQDGIAAQASLNLGYSSAAATNYDEALMHLHHGIEAKREYRLRRSPKKAGSAGDSNAPQPAHATTAASRPKPGGGRLADEAYALGYLAMIHGDRGEFTEAHGLLQQGLDIVVPAAERAAEGSLRTQLGMIQLWQGDWPGCLQTAKQMATIGERIYGPYILAMSKTVGGYAQFAGGAREQGIQHLEQALKWLQKNQVKLTLSWNLACYADAAALDGQIDPALEAAEQAITRSRGKDGLGEVMAHRARATAFSHRDDWSEAQRAFERGLEVAQAKKLPREVALTELRWSECAERANQQSSREAPAARTVQAALEFFVQSQMPYYAEQARSLSQQPMTQDGAICSFVPAQVGPVSRDK